MTKTTTGAWAHQQFDTVPDMVAAYRRGARPRLRFTAHAAHRRLEMKVTEDEIFAAIARPEYIGYSPRHAAMNLSAGRVTLAVKLDTGGFPDVCTILWWTEEQWNRAEQAGTLGPGRTNKGVAPTTRPIAVRR